MTYSKVVRYFCKKRQSLAHLIIGVCLLLNLSSAQATELSGAITYPAGGILNSLYLSGSPVSGATIKVRSDNDWEYSAFLGGAVVLSMEKLSFFNSRAYSIIGFSLPLALNLGGGIYLKMPDPSWGLRLQYTTLVTGGGSVLGANTAGPFPIGWLALLFVWRF